MNVTDPFVPAIPMHPAPQDFGSTGGGLDLIDYPGPPVTDPPSMANIVVDSDYHQWQYGPEGWKG